MKNKKSDDREKSSKELSYRTELIMFSVALLISLFLPMLRLWYVACSTVVIFLTLAIVLDKIKDKMKNSDRVGKIFNNSKSKKSDE
ncbi:MAG TPA: hypothetical protein ENH35_05165 [Candidatus Moranbacteria bacterium]|nr:hypothetical protein [Candidatus Moranbacteria bacterium]